MKLKFHLIFFLLVSIVIKAQSLKDAQTFVDQSNYKSAIFTFEQIKINAKKSKNIKELTIVNNALADCYTDLGAYYKSNILLKENLKLLESSKIKYFDVIAQSHLLLANNYDNLFFFEEFLKHSNQYYFFIKKAFPKKEIYKSIYYAYLGKYYNIKFQIESAFFYTNGALEILSKNSKDANLIDVYKLYNAHSFTLRNVNKNPEKREINLKNFSNELNKHFPFDNVKKGKMLMSKTMFDFDNSYNRLMNNDVVGNSYKTKTFAEFDKANAIFNKYVGNNYDVSAKINNLKSLLFLASKDYKNALIECNLGIAKIAEKDLLAIGFANNNYHIITALRQKHLIQLELNKVNPKIELQQNIIDNLLLMEKIWDRYSQDQISSNDVFLSRMYNENPYSFLFQAYLTMFEITNDKKYLEKIHEYDEKSKYNSLLSIAYLNPSEKKEKELLFNKRQEIYLLYDEYNLAKNNKYKSQFSLKQKLVEQIKKYNTIEKNSKLFKKSKIVSINEIQENLTTKDAVISYINTEVNTNYLYAKIITKNNVQLIKINRLDNYGTNYYPLKLDSLNNSIRLQNINQFLRCSNNYL